MHVDDLGLLDPDGGRAERLRAHQQTREHVNAPFGGVPMGIPPFVNGGSKVEPSKVFYS